jgi:exosortase
VECVDNRIDDLDLASFGNHAHGFVVLPIVLWLICVIVRLARLIQPTALPRCAGIRRFRLACRRTCERAGGAQFLVVAMIPLAVWSMLGTAMARALAFPLGFLFFAVPFGDFVVPVLMDWTADFTVMALRATVCPPRGEVVCDSLGNWSVVEACSVSHLIASLVVGTL